MKRIKSTILYGLLVASSGLLVTSCADKLDLSPIDYYGSGSYWKTEAQATAYIDGIHKHLRDAAWQHTITFGELRGGRFITGASSCLLYTSTAYGIMNMTGVFAGAFITDLLGKWTDGGNLGLGFAMLAIIVFIALAVQLYFLRPKTDNME